MRKIFFVTIAFMLVLPSIGWAQAQQAPAEILSPQDCEKNGFKDCVFGIKWGTQVNKDFMEQNEGAIPPGVSVFKELEVRVRKPTGQ